MRRFLRLWDLVLIVALTLGAYLWLTGPAWAEPTPVNRQVVWDPYPASVPIDGFYIYWAPEAESPRVYSDARRVPLPGATRTDVLVIADVTPDAADRLCFRLTASRGTLESAYSTEACGFFGIPSPGNVRAE